jgi:class 3 adenylate cyclase
MREANRPSAYSLRSEKHEGTWHKGTHGSKLFVRRSRAVTLSDRLDYFGQTINIAARVQGLAESRSIFATEPVIANGKVAEILRDRRLVPAPQRALLKGIKDELTVYEIG